MAKAHLSVVSPVESQHAADICDLGAKTFGNYFNMHRDLKAWYLQGSHYDWQASAVGLADGKMVTHYGVWGYDMRIGKAVVRCGGIGLVATHGEYRKQGLMADTIPHSLKMMKSRGYDLSILFGIWDFYHRFGYTRAWNETTWFVSLDQLPKELPTIRYESLETKPNPIIAELHNRYTAEMTGAAVRPTYSNAYCTFGQKAECSVWKSKGNARGRISGHVMSYVANGRLNCTEATGEVDAILAVLASIARKQHVKEIRFETLPYLSPLARKLRALTCRCERSYVKSGGAMVRVINLRSCLTKMAVELEDRLKASHLAGYRGELLVASPEESVGLRINKGKVSVAEKVGGKHALRAGWELAQLLIGTDDPMEICEAGKIRLTGDAAQLVPVLFPNEYPQLQQADRY